ncbi:TRAP transporter large permease [Shumkonia mesophila]|uniref:TRAP transporter large permease n=1 Tax=Shumkonia mesophila TaxID=2838854 RepID=UPI00293492A6|nr:TRAP transporter large permease [Shumkonia mesophila]
MLLVGIVFVVLLALGTPVAFSVGLSGGVFFLLSDTIPSSIAVQRIASASQSFPLLAVPFFVLAGNLMNRSGITERLLRFSNVLVAWMAGGLAQVCIMLSALMGGISGAAVTDACMEARILAPTMVKKGYPAGFTAAVIIIGSLITPTIPPSIGLILYGFTANVSIGRLFLGGVVPGVLMASFLMLAVFIVSRRKRYGIQEGEVPTLSRIASAAYAAKWALFFPVLLLGGIRFGIFTPSEAGAFAVVYALIIGRFVYGELTLGGIREAFSESLNDIGMIMLIIMFSAMIGYVIVMEHTSVTINTFIGLITDTPMVKIALILAFLIVIGMFVEGTVNILLFTPIFAPIAASAGFDPVHFGVIMTITVTMGTMTPPLGVAMYAVCGIMKCPVEDYILESWPFFVAIAADLLLLLFIPDLVLFLPKHLM